MTTISTSPFSYLGNFFNTYHPAGSGILVSDSTMDTQNREVVRPLWTIFLDDFTRRNRKRPVSVYTQQFDGAQRVRASGVPLDKVSLDIDHGHKNFVHICLAPQGFQRGVDFMFCTRAISELFDDSQNLSGLVFDTSNGVQTVLHF